MFSEVVDQLVGLTDQELIERIRANELERRRLDAEMAAALAVAEQRGVEGLDGHRSMAAFCRANLNWSTAEAGRRMGLARAVDHLPGFGDAWYDGRFGVPQASQFSRTYGNERVRERLVEFSPILLEKAELLPFSDFAATVEHFVSLADEDGAHDARDIAIEGRRARVTDVGGTLDVRAAGGDGLTTAEMIAIHDRFTDLEFEKDCAARRAEHGDRADAFPLARTDRQRRFDALVEIFRSAATAAASDAPARWAEPLVNIAVDVATWGRILVEAGFSTGFDLEGRPIDPFTGLPIDVGESLVDRYDALVSTRCETSNGVSLHPHDVLRAALAGHVRRVVVDAQSVVIDMGRRQRLFSGNARAAAKFLTRHCEHTGCELPVDWCEVDHMVEWNVAGATDQDNAGITCRAHNNEKHRRRWRTERSRDGRVITFRSDGTAILPVGVRPPDMDRWRWPDADDADDTPDGSDSPAEIAYLALLARQRLSAHVPATA